VVSGTAPAGCDGGGGAALTDADGWCAGATANVPPAVDASAEDNRDPVSGVIRNAGADWARRRRHPHPHSPGGL